MENKRVSARAIIFMGDKIVSMYREKDGRKFYTFPGGGMEEGETEEACVQREVLEEFGITIKPVKKVYVYENERSLEHYYICEHISGELGSGTGEEFQIDRNKGIYIPTAIALAKIPELPLMPPEIASTLVADFKKNGKSLTDVVKKVDGHYN